ncbi:phosphatidylinositol transporter protein [Moesziomyces antarcticus]|uniref:Related to CSR1 - phosphatidylinositol transfer protein n=2 Tax=Pseudozyma antarctica TaxID=84753 RepID=A0A5C3FWA5_PSEA2|nr:phosphatidylinositol transporter protein [Moesziomyces antarcticus]GAK66304.1 phosphatidylinositol transporter protein [Moesziomyces antarcticus]SPO48500.1 related to CSR1 - phosphatidylinositol transfer protein [Moesziomyces antarcticus]
MLESSAVDYLHSPGYRANLTPSQTLALFKLWRRFLRLCEISSHSTDSIAQPHPRASTDSSRRTNQRRRHRATASEPASSASTSHDNLDANAGALDPSAIPKDDRLKEHLRHLEESKEMQAFLLQHGGAALRREFWAIVKGEHPDAYMLRCLRARKWDVDRALAIIGATCAFRVQYNVSAIMKHAELGLTSTRGGFNIMNNGLSYIYGATAAGEPVYFIEVGAHYSSNQTADELKRGVILMQETLQMLMPPPVERKVVIFNLSNFGIRNMDWSVVLFMAKTMESFYPETLARVYVHGAPWIFKPIWSILRPLLDPVVRDKVHLTWSVDELSDHVPAKHLPQSTIPGGKMDWAFEYPVPDEGENDIQKDAQTAGEMETLYRDACVEFEYATRALARAYGDAALADAKGAGIRPKFGRARGNATPVDDEDWEPEGTASLRANRDILATKVRVAWLRLKPYVVGTLKYDRWRVTDAQGTIRWTYTTTEGEEEVQVLGEGTSLDVLQRNLAELDAAQRVTKPLSQPRLDAATKSNGASAKVAATEQTQSEEEPRASTAAHTAASQPESEAFHEPIPVHPSQMAKLQPRDADVDASAE